MQHGAKYETNMVSHKIYGSNNVQMYTSKIQHGSNYEKLKSSWETYSSRSPPDSKSWGSINKI
jgi:hypothetical protein